LVTLKEDPFLPRRGASRLYDSEGVLVKPATLVDQGVLQTFLLSTYSAKKLSMKTTGHAGGVSNILVPAGQRTREELLREMGTGLWLTGVSGQGVKLSTGDYSRGASGLWVERGEVVHAVDECTINSTLPEVFRGIVAMDNGVESRFQIQTPGLLVASLSLAGVS
jgi:PmbA protein